MSFHGSVVVRSSYTICAQGRRPAGCREQVDLYDWLVRARQAKVAVEFAGYSSRIDETGIAAALRALGDADGAGETQPPTRLTAESAPSTEQPSGNAAPVSGQQPGRNTPRNRRYIVNAVTAARISQPPDFTLSGLPSDVSSNPSGPRRSAPDRKVPKPPPCPVLGGAGLAGVCAAGAALYRMRRRHPDCSTGHRRMVLPRLRQQRQLTNPVCPPARTRPPE